MSVAARDQGASCPICGASFQDALFCPKDGARLQPPNDHDDAYVGAVVAGDVELLECVGSGAMGRVYRARQRSIDRDVAVKILHRELSGNALLARRFHREAKIASKLRHPHVVDMHLVGEHKDGSLFIVMEFLDGGSLASLLLESGGKLPLERALAIARQMIDAVGEAHSLGIVHRDLKPENVMLVRRGHQADWVKVLDFGIARVEVGEQSMETAAGGVFGTARYISPEGAAGEPVGPAGDVYALATILYQMLAGQTPFDAPAPLGLLVKHVHEPPPSLDTLAPQVPAPIAQVIMDNLAKEPQARAANAHLFGAAIEAATVRAAVGGSPRTMRSPIVRHDPRLDPTMVQEHFPTPAPQSPQTLDLPKPPPTGVNVTLALDAGPTRRNDETTAHDAISSSTESSSRTQPRRGPLWLILAFVLGAALAAGAATYLSMRDREHTEFIEHTRRALADGYFVSPPGENVRELVTAGLQRWKNDSELHQLRSQAQHEMITMVLAAQASGDLVGARDLAAAAEELDPADSSARYLRAQTNDALSAVANNVRTGNGAPRMVFELPTLVQIGERIEIRCRFVHGSAGPEAKLTELKLHVRAFAGGDPIEVRPLLDEPMRMRAALVLTEPGRYDVTLEAAIDGARVRAFRHLDVVLAAR